MRKYLFPMLLLFMMGNFQAKVFAEGKSPHHFPGHFSNHSYVPPTGFVPNKEVATSVAEAILFPIYGREKIEKQKPYLIELVNNVWVIQGALPPYTMGGTFKIKISKLDGRILLVTHSK